MFRGWASRAGGRELGPGHGGGGIAAGRDCGWPGHGDGVGEEETMRREKEARRRRREMRRKESEKRSGRRDSQLSGRGVPPEAGPGRRQPLAVYLATAAAAGRRGRRPAGIAVASGGPADTHSPAAAACRGTGTCPALQRPPRARRAQRITGPGLPPLGAVDAAGQGSGTSPPPSLAAPIPIRPPPPQPPPPAA